MPLVKTDRKGSYWTFGCEHELADWDTTVPLPEGFQRSPDFTIVNSNGIAAQPNPKVYRYGGEINTPPSERINDQAKLLSKILETYPNAAVNYRSNLHIHIRVPGLANDLGSLKRVQKFIHESMPEALPIIEPIPKGMTMAEKKREKRRKVSHWTLLTARRLEHQLGSKSVDDFFTREVPRAKNGKPLWHAQPRLCVNLRQLLQTDTVEFRHFPGTLNGGELITCIRWCWDFLFSALNDLPLRLSEYSNQKFPAFGRFLEETEILYQATAAHNGLKQAEIKRNIADILEGKFIGTEAWNQAKSKAEGRS